MARVHTGLPHGRGHRRDQVPDLVADVGVANDHVVLGRVVVDDAVGGLLRAQELVPADHNRGRAAKPGDQHVVACAHVGEEVAAQVEDDIVAIARQHSVVRTAGHHRAVALGDVNEVVVGRSVDVGEAIAASVDHSGEPSDMDVVAIGRKRIDRGVGVLGRQHVVCAVHADAGGEARLDEVVVAAREVRLVEVAHLDHVVDEAAAGRHAVERADFADDIVDAGDADIVDVAVGVDVVEPARRVDVVDHAVGNHIIVVAADGHNIALAPGEHEVVAATVRLDPVVAAVDGSIVGAAVQVDAVVVTVHGEVVEATRREFEPVADARSVDDVHGSLEGSLVVRPLEGRDINSGHGPFLLDDFLGRIAGAIDTIYTRVLLLHTILTYSLTVNSNEVGSRASEYVQLYTIYMKQPALVVGVLVLLGGGYFAYTHYGAPQGGVADVQNNRYMDIETYVRTRISELSPTKEQVGGTFHVTDIETHEGSGTVSYEDGHNGYTADFAYHITDQGQPVVDSFIIRPQQEKLTWSASAISLGTTKLLSINDFPDSIKVSADAEFGSSDTIKGALLSPDGKWVAIAVGGAAHDFGWVYNIATKKLTPVIFSYGGGVTVQEWKSETQVAFAVTTAEPKTIQKIITVTALPQYPQ
jgi:hypothetical protein